jgi:hypothetical protein
MRAEITGATEIVLSVSGRDIWADMGMLSVAITSPDEIEAFCLQQSRGYILFQ